MQDQKRRSGAGRAMVCRDVWQKCCNITMSKFVRMTALLASPHAPPIDMKAMILITLHREISTCGPRAWMSQYVALRTRTEQSRVRRARSHVPRVMP